MAAALEAGTRLLIAWPLGRTARKVQLLPRARMLAAVHGVKLRIAARSSSEDGGAARGVRKQPARGFCCSRGADDAPLPALAADAQPLSLTLAAHMPLPALAADAPPPSLSPALAANAPLPAIASDAQPPSLSLSLAADVPLPKPAAAAPAAALAAIAAAAAPPPQRRPRGARGGRAHPYFRPGVTHHTAQGAYTPPHTAQGAYTSPHTAQGAYTPPHTAQGAYTSPHTAQGAYTSPAQGAYTS
jgi:hypothetical protein